MNNAGQVHVLHIILDHRKSSSSKRDAVLPDIYSDEFWASYPILLHVYVPLSGQEKMYLPCTGASSSWALCGLISVSDPILLNRDKHAVSTPVAYCPAHETDAFPPSDEYIVLLFDIISDHSMLYQIIFIYGFESCHIKQHY